MSTHSIAVLGLSIAAVAGCNTSHVNEMNVADAGPTQDAFIQADASAMLDANTLDAATSFTDQVWMTSNNHDMLVRNLEVLRIGDALHVGIIVDLRYSLSETATQVIYARGPANDASASTGGRGWVFEVIETRLVRDSIERIASSVCSLAISDGRAYMLYALTSAGFPSTLMLATANADISSPFAMSAHAALTWTDSDLDTSTFAFDEAHIAADEDNVGVVFFAHSEGVERQAACRAGIIPADTGTETDWQAFECAHVGAAVMDADAATSNARLRAIISPPENDSIEVVSLVAEQPLSRESLMSWHGTDSLIEFHGFFAKNEAIGVVYATFNEGEAAWLRTSDGNAMHVPLVAHMATSHPQSDAMYFFDYRASGEPANLHVFDGQQHTIRDFPQNNLGMAFGVDAHANRISVIRVGGTAEPIMLTEGPLP